jgi:hypothetical protein
VPTDIVTAEHGLSIWRRRPTLLDGAWIETRESIEVRSPYSGDVVGRVAKAGAGEARRAVDGPRGHADLTSLLRGHSGALAQPRIAARARVPKSGPVTNCAASLMRVARREGRTLSFTAIILCRAAAISSERC